MKRLLLIVLLLPSSVNAGIFRRQSTCANGSCGIQQQPGVQYQPRVQYQYVIPTPGAQLPLPVPSLPVPGTKIPVTKPLPEAKIEFKLY